MGGGIYAGETFQQEGQMMRGIDHQRRRAYLEMVYEARLYRGECIYAGSGNGELSPPGGWNDQI